MLSARGYTENNLIARMLRDARSLAIQLELEKIHLKTHYLSTKKTTPDDLVHRIEAGHLKNYVDSRKELIL